METTLKQKRIDIECATDGWIVRISGNVCGQYVSETTVVTAREIMMDFLSGEL